MRRIQLIIGALLDDRWSYSGVEGALVFCVDKAKGGLWFRVVTLSVSDCSHQSLTKYPSAYNICLYSLGEALSGSMNYPSK